MGQRDGAGVPSSPVAFGTLAPLSHYTPVQFLCTLLCAFLASCTYASRAVIAQTEQFF